MELLAVIMILGVLGGVFSGYIALARISHMKQQLDQLQHQLKSIQQQLPGVMSRQSGGSHPQRADTSALSNGTAGTAITAASPTSPTVPSESKGPEVAVISPSDYQHYNASVTSPSTPRSPLGHDDSNPMTPQEARGAPGPSATHWLSWLERQLIDRGMVWLGALALACGGIFLVRHSLEAGWFSPALRVASGVVFALIMLVASEWLHQKKVLSQQLENYIPAALASAGFITLYAALLMALQLYQLISAPVAFVLLALVALAASWFSLRQGPILAVIGIIGAYAVPLVASTGSNNVPALLMYLAVITASSVLVERRVQRGWLWYLPMAAHCGWLWLILWQLPSQHVALMWIALLASMVALVWLPRLGYRLRSSFVAVSMREWLPPVREHCLAIVLLGLMLLLQVQGTSPLHFYGTLCLLAVLYGIALTDGRSELALWLALAMLLGWLMMSSLPATTAVELFSGAALQWQLVWFMTTLPAVIVIIRWPDRVQWAAFLALAPVLILATVYQALPQTLQPQVQLAWMFYAAVLVLVQAWLARRTTLPEHAFILAAGANLALSWCFTLYLSAAALTVAFAMQLVLITLLSYKQRFPLPFWVVKVLVGVVLLRLTSAPLLGSYESITVLGLHWSFVVYPLVLCCFAMGMRLWRNSALGPWLEGATLHLLAVFISVQTQYWLNDGTLDFRQLDVYSLTLHAANWLLLALVYQWRSYLAGSLQGVYQVAAFCLLVVVAVIQFLLLTEFNPFWTGQAVGTWPVANWLFLMWGVPALGYAVLAWFPAPNRYHPMGYYVAAAFAGIFLLGAVRQFWQVGYITYDLFTTNAEHYSYSVVFLLVAALVIVGAEMRKWVVARKAGFMLLCLVVVKVFVFDLNQLTGLWRAASFMGLGLSLVLLSALFQRLQRRQTHAV